MHMSNVERSLQRELTRPGKKEEHSRKGEALGISAEDHARLTHLFLKAGVASAAFRGLTGEPLAERIRTEWRARVMGETTGPNA